MNIALLYIAERMASTVFDHLESFEKYSIHHIQYFDIWKDKITIDLFDNFDIVIIHYTISLFNDDRCPAWLRVVLKNTTAKKIVFIQDEYRLVNDVVQNLQYIHADMLFTCVPDSEVEKMYPIHLLPKLKKINTLTGFVPKKLLDLTQVYYQERSLDVVYRSRKLSAWYGRLCLEKWVIAEKFLKSAKSYDLKVDISSLEKDRIYGEDWIKFLQNSKAALGVESGANVIDFTGDIQRNVEAYEKKHPKASFEEIEKKFFKGLDGKIKMNQISPRCFECAALGTLMILYEGEYSGILIPWQHYVPLKKDHSNMEIVVTTLRDQKKWQEITERAYLEIALNPKYSYEYFIKSFDKNVNIFCKNYTTFKKENTHSFMNKVLENGRVQEKIILSTKRKIRKLFVDMLSIFPESLNFCIDSILRAVKRRIMLSVRTLESLLKNHEWRYIGLFWNKNFCTEYKNMFLLRTYILSVKKSLKLIPLSKTLLDKHTLELRISPNINKKALNDFNCINQVNNIKIICENSWGLPQDIRGKSYVLKYKKLINYMMDF